MSTRFSFGALCLGCIVSIVFWSCKKSDLSTGSSSDEELPPAVTSIGTPVGSTIMQTIGPSGGNITSDDGKIELTIPAGALSTSTNISIQSVTNECPGAIGLSYNLLPNGLQFSTPASLVFHYTDDDINGTDPLLFYAAFQDSANEWEVVDSDKEIDSASKTVSFDISHFTIYSIEPGVYIYASADELHENEQSGLEVRRWVRSKNKVGPRLVPAKPYASSLVTDWSVNRTAGGNAQYGTVAGSDQGQATYTAPSNITDERSVDLSVIVNEPETIRLRKGRLTTFQKRTYHRSIKLIGKLSFDVRFYLTETGLSDILPDVYHDEVSMVVNVKDDEVDVPDATLVNQRPTVTPASDGDLKDGPGYRWIPDGTGLINIKSASGIVISSDPKIVVLTFVSGNTVSPQYTIYDPGLGPYSKGGDATPPWPETLFEFDLKDSAQGKEIKPGWGYTVTPRH